tara:strand:+ start:26916 stop:27386 length:471 start_codon:yes stop_codon:yes gene_type:complete
MPLIYNYDAETGELLSNREARLDPLAGLPLVPNNATLERPTTAGDNQASVFSDGAWSLVSDYRGTTYWLNYLEEVSITGLGVTKPLGASDTQPEKTSDQLSSEVRFERDFRLGECDWMGNSDVTMTTLWKNYRTALRNLPSQDGFPSTITWPTKPE